MIMSLNQTISQNMQQSTDKMHSIVPYTFIL